MKRMPAVLLTRDRKISLVEHPVPVHRQDQVVVDVDLCGICGSDLHAPNLPQVYLGGVVMGHEATGTISWVGDQVDGWAPGQRVALNPNGNVDGTCEYCRAGRPNFCIQATLQTALGLQSDGSLAPQVSVSPGNLRALPATLDRVAAAWVEPAATALRAVRLAGDLTGRTVLVTGGGPIGQLALKIARARGAGRLLLVEPSPVRRHHGFSSGADTVWDPAEVHEPAADAHIDVVIEASGSGAASALGLTVLVPGGTFVAVAGQGNSLDATTILLKEITVRGSFTYTDEFDAAIDLLTAGTITVDDLASVVLPIRDVLTGFDLLREAAAMKFLIDPRA